MSGHSICRLPEVVKLTGLPRSTIYALIKENRFPGQISLGPRTVGWVRQEIDQWIEEKVSQSRR